MPSTSTLVDSIYTRRVSAGECYPPDLVKSHKIWLPICHTAVKLRQIYQEGSRPPIYGDQHSRFHITADQWRGATPSQLDARVVSIRQLWAALRETGILKN